MRKIWDLLKQHLKEDFSIHLYLTIALFLALFIAINYSINLENGIIDRHAGKPVRILLYFALYATAYYGACVVTFASNRKLSTFSSPRFLMWSLIGLFILSINVGFP